VARKVTIMTSVGDNERTERHGSRGESTAEEKALLSPRAFLIMATASLIGLVPAVAAGVKAALSIAASVGSTTAIAVGLGVGLATYALVWLSVAAALHGLIGKRDH
jgi:hypothetical protein